MLLEITEKIILENAFEQKKKKSGFNLTLGSALIGLPTTDPWLHYSIGSFAKFFRGKLFMPSHNALRNVNKDGGVFQMCGCVHFVKFLCKEENVTG